MCKENFIIKDKLYQTNDKQIKCISGAVFDASIEPLLPEILTDYYNKRKKSKAISQMAEREIGDLQKILKSRKKKI